MELHGEDTAGATILLSGGGWRREVEPPEVRDLAERLRVLGNWTLGHKLSVQLQKGGELVLTKEEKRTLYELLSGMVSLGDRSTRLNLLCHDLEDDLASYEG